MGKLIKRCKNWDWVNDEILRLQAKLDEIEAIAYADGLSPIARIKEIRVALSQKPTSVCYKEPV